jgi:SH3-like domain-containing protein
MRKKMPLYLLIFSLFLLIPVVSGAQEDSPNAFRSTPFPLPRFVSLGSDEVFVRTGPGQQYPLKWVFKKSGLPVEIILEYEAWRKIRDYDGQVGWIHKSLTIGDRAALVRSTDLVPVRQKPKADARLAAYIENKALVKLEECGGDWCEVSTDSGYGGWIERKFLWGVYEGENFD